MLSVTDLLKFVPAEINLLVEFVKGYFPTVNLGSSTYIVLSTWTEVVPLSVIVVPTGTIQGRVGEKVTPALTSLKTWGPALNVNVQGEEYWEILPETLYKEL